jgi:hypothetical protein
VAVADSFFLDTFADDGGAISVTALCSVSIVHSYFVNCWASRGGALFHGGALFDLSFSGFHGTKGKREGTAISLHPALGAQLISDTNFVICSHFFPGVSGTILLNERSCDYERINFTKCVLGDLLGHGSIL